MFGLTEEEWRDLVLSVNVHRKNRRLAPIQVAMYLKRALRRTDVETLSSSLGFNDTSTVHRILRLQELPEDFVSVVDWGSRKGSVSMSTASELMRLKKKENVRAAIELAAEHRVTKEEARQVVQIYERSDKSLEEAFQGALKTRPKIERSELIIGSLLSDTCQRRAVRLGNAAIEKKLRMLLAQHYPDITCRAVRVSGHRFSLLLHEDQAQQLRNRLGGKSIERAITELVERMDS